MENSNQSNYEPPVDESQFSTPEPTTEALEASSQSPIFNKRNAVMLSVAAGVIAVVISTVAIVNIIQQRPERVINRAFNQLIETDSFKHPS